MDKEIWWKWRRRKFLLSVNPKSIKSKNSGWIWIDSGRCEGSVVTSIRWLLHWPHRGVSEDIGHICHQSFGHCLCPIRGCHQQCIRKLQPRSERFSELEGKCYFRMAHAVAACLAAYTSWLWKLPPVWIFLRQEDDQTWQQYVKGIAPAGNKAENVVSMPGKYVHRILYVLNATR